MHKNFSSGFTLLEILVVMGILTVVAGFGLALSLDGYRDYLFRDERDTVIGALQKARSQAINNVCLGSGCSDGVPHGVFLQNSQYTIFQGASYAGRNGSVDQILPSNYGSMSITGVTQV